tara:strand:+ start:3581 stop:4852 length:1272 start_codon:yes stop_codon:yes gene_type:complete
MKKVGYLVVFLLLISSVSGLSSDAKLEYQIGETGIVELQGNILSSIGMEQIDFRRGHVSVPMEFDFVKLDERYFVWFIAPDSEEEYTLDFGQILTTVGGKVKEVDFEVNFSVANGTVPYSVKPGALFVNGDFDINIRLNEDLNRDIEISEPFPGTITLKPGDNKVKFEVSEIQSSGFLSLGVGDYLVPIFVLKEDSEEKVEISLPDLRFRPRFIESVRIVGGEVEEYPFALINSGDEEISFIIDYNDSIFVVDRPEEILIGPESVELFTLMLNSDFFGQDVSEIVYANSGEFSLEFPIDISFTENEEEVKTDYLEPDFKEEEQFYCSELDGKICIAGEVCSISEIDSRDGACCVGSGVCGASDEGSNFGIWIGILIFGIVLLIVIIAYKKYKKAKPSASKLEKSIEPKKPKRVSRDPRFYKKK